MKIKPILQWLPILCQPVVWLCFCGTVVSQENDGNKITNVAIVSASGAALAQDAMALIEASLLNTDGIRLIERQQIGSVLDEQQLSLSGVVDGRFAAQVGGLVAADLFANLQTRGDKMTFVVFDAKLGTCLASVRLPNDLESAAKEVVKTLQRVEKKRTSKDGLKTICVAAVRNVDLPKIPFDSQCNALGPLLDHELTLSDSVALLERRQLDWVNRERAISKDAALQELVGSLLVVNVDVQQSKNSKREPEFVARVSRVDGTPTGETISVTGSDLATVAHRLVNRLAKDVNVELADLQFDRGIEAERFRDDAAELYFNLRFDEAINAIESAFALDPHNIDVLHDAAKIFSRRARKMHEISFSLRNLPSQFVSSKELKTHLDYAERAFDFRARLCRELLATKQPMLIKYNTMVANGSVGCLTETDRIDDNEKFFCMETLLLIEGQHDASTRAQLQRIQAQYRHIELDLINANASAAVHDQESFVQYSNYLHVLLGSVSLFSPTADAWAEDVTSLVEAWLKLAKTHGAYHNEFCNINLMFASLFDRMHQLDRVGNKGQWRIEAKHRRKMQAMFKSMQKHPEPAIAFLGNVGEFCGCHNNGRIADDKVLALFDDLFELAEEKLSQSGPRESANRAIIYNALLDAAEFLNDAKHKRAAVDRTFALMLKRKEMVYGVAYKAVEPQYITWSHYEPYRFRMPQLGTQHFPTMESLKSCFSASELALKSFDDSEFKLLDSDPGRTRSAVLYVHGAMVDRFGLPSTQIMTAGYKIAFDVSMVPSALNVTTPFLKNDRQVFFNVLGRFPDGRGFMQLTELDLKTGELKSYKPVVLKQGLEWKSRTLPVGANVAPVVVGDFAYLGVFGYGICKISLKNGEHKWIDEKQGLPSKQIHRITEMNGKLYVASSWTEGGFLSSFDLKTERFETIVSARRSIGQTPLDNTHNLLIICSMVADKDRQKLYFVVSLPTDDKHGLWELDTATNKIRQCVDLGNIHWMSGDSDGNLLLAVANGDMQNWNLLKYDTASNKATLVYSTTKVPFLSEFTPDEKAVFANDLSCQPPFVFHKQWLWAGEPFAQINTETGVEQFLPSVAQRSLDPRDLLLRRQWFGWRSMTPVLDGKAMLVFDFDCVALVPMPAEK